MTRSTKCKLLSLISILTWLLFYIFLIFYPKVPTSLEVLFTIWINFALFSVIVTISYILFSGEIKKIQGVVLMLVYIVVGSFIGGPATNKLAVIYGARHWEVGRSRDLTRIIGNALLSYESSKGHFPSGHNWCDSCESVLEQENSILGLLFRVDGKQNNSCGYAFNNNLSELPIDGLEPSTVLIFEADGIWNHAGGSELFPGIRYRDQYFPRRERFAFVFFIDGTLTKYRLHDGAVALYSSDNKNFSDWHKKGETQYSPLKWKAK